jgi:hypothetical protein
VTRLLKDFSRRQIVVALLILLLVPSTLLIFRLGNEREILIHELESAEFTVIRFDITGGTADSLTAEGMLRVNLSRQAIPPGISITTFEVDLYNDTEFITSLEVPVTNILESELVNFSIGIPVNSEEPSTTTSTILVNIMTGLEFTLDFDSRIRYRAGGLPGTLEFSNRLDFQLEQRSLEVDLDQFALPSSPSEFNSTIDFTLYNPFSSIILMGGDIAVLVQSIMSHLNWIYRPQV